MLESSKIWVQQVPKEKNQESSINSLDCNLDASRLIVGVGARVLVYEAYNGKLLHCLKGHCGTVYSVSCSRTKESRQIASGGADNTVILWNEHGKGILKYSHKASVQVVKYNPKFQILASCSNIDFGFWAQDKKSVTKHKVDSKILAADWSLDGNLLAIGMQSGSISVRDLTGKEARRISRFAPVRVLAWIFSGDAHDTCDSLAVGCWDKSLSFYQLSGIQEGKDIELDFLPCAIDICHRNDGWLLVTGSNRSVHVCTKDGIPIKTVCQAKDWIWAVKSHPSQNRIFTGDFGGTLSMQTITCDSVYAIYFSKYAHRINMTDVMIQNTVSGLKTHVKGDSLIQKVALFLNLLVVKTSGVINIYETAPYDPDGIRYELKKRIKTSITCDQLAVTSKHLIFTNARNIILYDFNGAFIREWIMENKVRAVIVFGGIKGREAVLVATDAGDIKKLFVDNLFTLNLVHHSIGLKVIKVNSNRSQFAFIDDEKNFFVHDLDTGEMYFREKEVNTFSFGLDSSDTICYCRQNRLTIKKGKSLSHTESLCIKGEIMSYIGSKVYYHNPEENVVMVYNVGQAKIVQKLFNIGAFDEAYKEASVGIPIKVWQELAHRAMKSMNFKVARKCLVHLHDYNSIEIMERFKCNIEHNKPRCTKERMSYILKGSMHAILGEFENAAKAFVHAGDAQKAIDMYVDLKKWDDAHMIAIGSELEQSRQITSKQAEWEERLGNWQEAANLYIKAGCTLKAVDLIGETKGEEWEDSLISIVEITPSTHIEILRRCSKYFANANKQTYAKETYAKLGDFESLIKLYIDSKNWNEVRKIFQTNGNKFDTSQLIALAHWLVEHDQFEEAFGIYRKVEFCDRIHEIMEVIIKNAIVETRFDDVAYYLWLHGCEHLRDYIEERNVEGLEQYHLCMERSSWYHAYQFVNDYCDSPFTELQPDVLLQASSFLINTFSGRNVPFGISRVKLLYTLAKQACTLRAFKLARFAYRSLQELKIPYEWEESINLDTMLIQAKSYKNSVELSHVCFRCGCSSNLIREDIGTLAESSIRRSFLKGNMVGTDACPHCGHSFIRCFLNFDILPLVEFVLESDITHEEAMKLLIESPPVIGSTGENVIESDLFLDAIHNALEFQQRHEKYTDVTVDRKTLQKLRLDEVYVCSPSTYLSNEIDKPANRLPKRRYFKNMIPEIGIAMSQKCHRFFHEEDFELAYLKSGKCPISRVQDIGNYGHYIIQTK